jgi:chitinase
MLGLGLTVAVSPGIAAADDADSPSNDSRSPQSVSRRGADGAQEAPGAPSTESRTQRRQAGASRTAPVTPAKSRRDSDPGPGIDKPALPAAAAAPAPVASTAVPPADPVAPSVFAPTFAAGSAAKPVALPVVRALAQAIRAVASAAAPGPAGTRPSPMAATPTAIMTAAPLNSTGPTPSGAAGARVNPLDIVTAALALVSQEIDRLLNRRSTASVATTALSTAAVKAAATTGNTVTYSVVNDWGTGHTANMALTAGPTNLTSWSVEFDTPATIVNIWNAKITSHVGTHYVLSNESYNAGVAAGQSTSFGYQATPGAVGSAPTNIKVNGVAIGTSTPPAVPSMSIADVSVTEGSTGTTNANFTVSLSKAATTPITVGYTTTNGTATAGTDYTAASGTLTFAAGVTTQSIAVKVAGDTTVEPDETFTVTLANPTGATLSRATATGTIKNDDTVALPGVSIADVSVTEGSTGTTNANFTVSLSKAATTPITVGYTTTNGTATAGTDYTAASGTLTFAAGVTTQTIAVKVAGDTTVEPDETFTVTLTNPTGATLSRATATATIKNDDTAPAQIGPTVAYSVVNDWGTGHTANMAVTAGQTNLSSWTVEFDSPATIVNVWNAKITSHVGTHYVITNESYNASVAAGQSTTFGYQATPGSAGSAPTNLKINGVPAGTSTPALPAVSIADVSVTEGNGEHAHFMFTVALDKASTTPVTVNYATSDGTATAGSDYVAGSGTLTFAAGVTAQTVHVDIIGDTTVEPSETFKVTLSNAAGATISRAVAIGTILNDDGTTTPAIPGLSISDASVSEPGSSGIAAGYLHTSGNQIVDSQGKPVQLSSVNWFGAESTNLVPHGLWTRNYKDMIDQMSDQGFNTIRLAYSSEMLHTTAKPSGIDYYQNPDLQGLSAIQVMDKIVDYAGQKGMLVVLDHHRSSAGAGTSENGL